MATGREPDMAVGRCLGEISEIERLLQAGHPDLVGLLHELVDWSMELRLLQAGQGAKSEAR
jgi:hypothetical protein